MHNCFCRDYGGFVQRLWNPPHKLAEVCGVFRLIGWLDNTRRYELADGSGDLVGWNCLAVLSSRPFWRLWSFWKAGIDSLIEPAVCVPASSGLLVSGT